MDERSEFARRLQKLREREHRSRRVASELCGLNPNAFRLYERDEVKPGMEAMIAIADYYQVSLDYLTGRTNY